MNCESEAQLMSFCVEQRDAFCSDAWIDFGHPDKNELAAACAFLASSDWYGHEQELEQVAQTLRPDSDLESLVKASRFDCLRFSTTLRRELRHALCAS